MGELSSESKVGEDKISSPRIFAFKLIKYLSEYLILECYINQCVLPFARFRIVFNIVLSIQSFQKRFFHSTISNIYER